MFVFENGIREKFREATEINIVVTFLTQVNTAFLDNMNSIWNYNSLLNRSQNWSQANEIKYLSFIIFFKEWSKVRNKYQANPIITLADTETDFKN